MTITWFFATTCPRRDMRAVSLLGEVFVDAGCDLKNCDRDHERDERMGIRDARELRGDAVETGSASCRAVRSASAGRRSSSSLGRCGRHLFDQRRASCASARSRASWCHLIAPESRMREAASVDVFVRAPKTVTFFLSVKRASFRQSSAHGCPSMEPRPNADSPHPPFRRSRRNRPSTIFAGHSAPETCCAPTGEHGAGDFARFARRAGRKRGYPARAPCRRASSRRPQIGCFHSRLEAPPACAEVPR